MKKSPKLIPDWKADADDITIRLNERIDARVGERATRKVYTPKSKYVNSSTGSTNDAKGGARVKRVRPASASMAKSARKQGSAKSIGTNVWESKKGKKHKKLALRNITNVRNSHVKKLNDQNPYEASGPHKKKRTKRTRPRSASAARSSAKKTAIIHERTLKGLERNIPLTQERVIAENITDSVFRTTRPKSANVFGRSSTGGAESILQPGRRAHQHASKYTIKSRPFNGQASNGSTTSTMSKRPKSAPHKRPSSGIASKARKRTTASKILKRQMASSYAIEKKKTNGRV